MVKHLSRSILAVFLCVMMLLSVVPSAFAAADESGSVELKDGTYAEGEVLVMFKNGSLERRTSSRKALKAVRAMDDVADDFGTAMEATNTETAAAATVASQKEILKESLGDDFVIKDTVLFDDSKAQDGPDISLVSSGRYTTEKMIELLSSNDDISFAEPNYYTELSSADYSLNDAYASYSYQLYGQDSKNTESEKPANTRGFKDKQISINAPTGWKQYEESNSKSEDAVVALLDTGIDDYHEDLADVLWHNPNDIGLSGDYGYDFLTNSDNPVDNDGHGTHCAGIIAAQDNNDVGVAGVASKAGVKVMMLKVIGDPGVDKEGNPIQASTTFSSIGALAYVKKAKERGVNIVATNNSWGVSGGITSGMLDSYFTELGELGVINIIASGNDNMDNDLESFSPANTTNDYVVTVNSANEDGKKASYSCYGRASTDLFAPGTNVLSTVSYKSYLPCIKPADALPEDTLYYGEFSSAIKPDGKGKIKPVLGDDGINNYEEVGAFGAAKVKVPDGVTSKLEIVSEHSFNDSKKPGVLKWTLSGLRKNSDSIDSDCYLYFPYEKDSQATSANSYGSALCEWGFNNGENINGLLTLGDVIVDSEGQAEINDGGVGVSSYDVMKRGCGVQRHLYGKNLAAYNDVEDKEYGLGLRFSISDDDYDVDSISIYLDHMAVSRTTDGDSDVPGDFYDIMSGTSMATPVVTGAAALIAATHPEYTALQVKDALYSMVTKTPELSDLCSTGGYIDFDNITKAEPFIREAVADTTDLSDIKIKLIGGNFENGKDSGKLTVKRMSDDSEPLIIGQEKSSSSPYAVWENDVITIHNAGGLVGSYLSFEANVSDEKTASGKFFVTKGENAYTQVIKPTTADNEAFAVFDLFSDGKELYASNPYGDFYKLINGAFKELENAGMMSAMLKSDFYNKELGLSEYDIRNGKPSISFLVNPVYCDGYVYEWFSMKIGSTSIPAILASCDITSDSPSWKFSLCDNDQSEIVNKINENSDISGISKAVYNGKIYFISGFGDWSEEGMAEKADNGLSRTVYSFDPSERIITKESAMLPSEKGYLNMSFIEWEGALYGFMGLGEPKSDDSFNDDYTLSDDILKFDGKKWSVLDFKMPRTFRNLSVNKLKKNNQTIPALGTSKDGIIIAGVSVDGYGDTMLFDGEKLSPLYYSLYDGISDACPRSGASTAKGFYVTNMLAIDDKPGYELCSLPIGSGKEFPPEKVPKLNKTSASLKAGAKTSLKVTDGVVKSWTSSNKAVAKVSKGTVTALKKGTVTVTAKLVSGEKLTCKVKVNTSPKLSKSSITVKKGKTKTVKIKGKAKTVKNVYTNTKKAKVVSKKTASKIKVKGLKKGSTTLKIKVNGVVLKLKVKVK